MHLQRAVDDFDLFVRTIGIGPQVRIVKYDPAAPLHDRYRVDRNFVSNDEAKHLVNQGLTINAFFGWDFNSCESLRKDGVFYPIDFANACPDSQVTSLHYHFPWLVKALLQWSIFCAATKRRMRQTLDWEPFYDIARQGLPLTDALGEYAKIANAALRDRPVRRVLRQAPRPPRRGRLRLLRHRNRQARGAPQGRSALPQTRARHLHRALLGAHPDVARAGRRRLGQRDGGTLRVGRSQGGGQLRQTRSQLPEARSAFVDPLARIFDDPQHSVGERREILVGLSFLGRLILVCFVERESSIRIITLEVDHQERAFGL